MLLVALGRYILVPSQLRVRRADLCRVTEPCLRCRIIMILVAAWVRTSRTGCWRPAVGAGFSGGCRV